MTDGKIFVEPSSSSTFVVWEGSESELESEEQEQVIVYPFRGEDLVQITFDRYV